MPSPVPQPDVTRRAHTLQEIAEMYRCSVSFLYNEKNAGRLKIFKMGKKTLVSAEDLDAWVSSKKTAAEAA